MAKKKAEIAETKRIPVKDIKVNDIYKTYVNDIVKVTKINEESETITLYNVTGSYNQWISFKHIFLIEKI